MHVLFLTGTKCCSSSNWCNAEAELQSSPHFLCDYHRGDGHMFHFEHHLTRIWNTSTHHGNNGEHEFVCATFCMCM